MIQEAAIISLLFLGYGFFKYRKWLNQYRKDWWALMKLTWNQGKE